MTYKHSYLPLLSATVLLASSALPALADDQGQWIPIEQNIVNKTFVANDKYGEWRLVEDQTNVIFVRNGEWVLTNTEALKSFLADASLSGDLLGRWRTLDFNIDKVWIADAAASKQNVSHTQTARRLSGDDVEYDEVLKGSQTKYGADVVTYGSVSDDNVDVVTDIESRTTPNGAYSYQVETFRNLKWRQKTITKPYRITDTYAERIKHIYTFSVDFDDLNRITAYDPIAKTKVTCNVKDTSHETEVAVTPFAETGKTRLAYRDNRDVELAQELIDGSEHERQVPGSMLSLAGQSKSSINRMNKTFASNTQIGKSAAKVSYAGSRERAASRVDEVKPSEIKDSKSASVANLIDGIDKLAKSAVGANSAQLNSLTAQLAELKAQAAAGSLRSGLTAKVNASALVVEKAIAATRADIAAKAAAALAARNTADLAAKAAAILAAKNAATAEAQLVAEKAAKAAAEQAALSAAKQAEAAAAEQAAADKLAEAKLAAEKSAAEKAAAAKDAAKDDVAAVFASPAYNASKIGSTITGYFGWLSGDDVDNYRDVALAFMAARNDDERKAMIAQAKKKKVDGAAFFTDAQLKSLTRIGNRLQDSSIANRNAILNLMLSNKKTLDNGNSVWSKGTTLTQRIADVNKMVDKGSFTASEIKALNEVKSIFGAQLTALDLK